MPDPSNYDLTTKEGRAAYRSALAEERPELGLNNPNENEARKRIAKLEAELTYLKSSKIYSLLPGFETHQDQAQVEMDRFVSRWGLQITLQTLIINEKNLVARAADYKINDVSYILKVIVGLEKVLADYKDRYNEE